MKRVYPFIFILIMMIALLGLPYNTDGVTVAVLDSGVDKEHETLKGHVLKGFDFLDFDRTTQDPNGHGSHVSGIILSVEPDAKVLPIRVIDENGSLETNLAVPILYAIFNGADIINLSLSEYPNPLTKLAIKYGQMKGVIFVASAGNDSENKANYPSRYRNVISVGAMDSSTKEWYEDSNYGERIDYVTSGVRVKSVRVGEGETSKSGTSMSSAYISGLIASIHKNKKSLLLSNVKNELNKLSTTIIKDDREYKMINIDKFIASKNNEPYFWLKKTDFYTTKKEIEILIETENLQDIVIYDNGDLLKKKRIRKGKEYLKLRLENGTHNISIKTKDKEKLDYMFIVVDDMPPKLNAYTVGDEEYKLLIVEVEELTLQHISINDGIPRPAFTRENYNETLKSYYTEFEEGMLPLKIVVTDHVGHKTVLLKNQLEHREN